MPSGLGLRWKVRRCSSLCPATMAEGCQAQLSSCHHPADTYRVAPCAACTELGAGTQEWHTRRTHVPLRAFPQCSLKFLKNEDGAEGPAFHWQAVHASVAS